MAYVDVTDATFQDEVITKSSTATVVVDLWAPWCGPCRTLGPIIERVVDATGGEVVLAKVNVDDNPRISQTFQVQSIPAVFALRDGKVVDRFVGALPEHQVKAWIGKLAPAKSEADTLTDAGDEASLRSALALEPGHVRATIALAELLVERRAYDEALTVLARIPETADVHRIAAAARLGASNAGAVSAATSDATARLDALLDQSKDDEAARQTYLDLLAVIEDEAVVVAYRRKLASRLF